MAGKLYIFASKEETTIFRGYDETAGAMVQETFSPLGHLRERGIDAMPMPDNALLYRKVAKDGTETVKFLHELGPVVICRIDSDGRIQNEYRGDRNFSRPVAVDDLSLLEQLLAIFGGAAEPSASKPSAKAVKAA